VITAEIEALASIREAPERLTCGRKLTERKPLTGAASEVHKNDDDWWPPTALDADCSGMGRGRAAGGIRKCVKEKEEILWNRL